MRDSRGNGSEGKAANGTRIAFGRATRHERIVRCWRQRILFPFLRAV